MELAGMSLLTKECLANKTMANAPNRVWTFKSKFSASAYSWNGSAKAGTNLREAVSEIRKAAKQDPHEAVEAAIYLMERFWRAFENIDGSSGALGQAINNTIDKLLSVMIDVPANETLRKKWTCRLFDALQSDRLGFLDSLGKCWGQLCVNDSMRDFWIDELLPNTKRQLQCRQGTFYYFEGTSACLSCLLESARFDELRKLLDLDVSQNWSHECYWAEALVRQGDIDGVIRNTSGARS